MFAATVNRTDLLDLRLRAVADQLSTGSMAALMSHLVDAWRLPASERRALRAYLDALDEPTPPGERED